MSKFATYANDVCDQSLPNGSSGTFVVGGTTYTLPVKAELTTTVSTDTTPGTPFSGGSYAAQSLAGNAATPASAKGKNTTGALSYSGMPAGVWNDVYLRDSSATPKPMNFRGGSGLNKTVNAGDACILPIASVGVNET